jgi:hypothetical protein
MKRRVTCLAALVGCAGSAWAGPTLITFENIPGDIQAINNFYSGITFGSSSSGAPLVTRRASTGNYNVSSFDLGTSYGSGEFWINGDVGVTSALDNSGNDGRISFDNEDATFVEVMYSCTSTFWLEAYDTNGNLLDSDSGPANLRYANNNPNGMGTLRVDWDGVNHISYVIVHDTGNRWIIDNVYTDASDLSTVIPLPTASALAGVGLLVLGARRRRGTL